jgi:hypothetical protein
MVRGSLIESDEESSGCGKVTLYALNVLRMMKGLRLRLITHVSFNLFNEECILISVL